MILGIESSCDESALACFDPSVGLSHELICSQIELHSVYGGVVPDLASREHLNNFVPLIDRLMSDFDLRQITEIAVTRGPGLAACLAMGITIAKAISISLNVPLRGVNHLHGHAFSPFIPVHAQNPKEFETTLKTLLPHLGLIVSGGNTIAIRIDHELQIKTLAETVDDAAGEAIDKGAKLLGLSYPGGPIIEKLAATGKPSEHRFPVSFPEPDDLRFSFSGLKTSLRYTLEKMDDEYLKRELPNLCHSYQSAIVEQLVRKTGHLLDVGEYRSIGLSGGVANNGLLRERFIRLGQQYGVPALIADRGHTGDNASMIAFASWLNPALTVPDTLESPLTFDPSIRVDTVGSNAA